MGVSLNFPKAYSAEKPKRDGMRHFTSPAGYTASVAVEDQGRLVDMPELIKQVKVNISASIADYKLTDSIPVTLPNNIPATLLTGTCFKGSSTVVTLVAIDGTRLINVTIGGKTTDPAFVAEAKAIAQSLRITQPMPAAQK